MTTTTPTPGLWIHGYEHFSSGDHDFFDAEVVSTDPAAGTVTVMPEGCDPETEAVTVPADAVTWNWRTGFFDADFGQGVPV